MKTDNQDLRERAKKFALRIVRLYVALPKTTEAQVIGKQVLRSGTSVGAHYREAQRAKSNADFINKIESGLQELDETAYWLELLEEASGVEKVHCAVNDTVQKVVVNAGLDFFWPQLTGKLRIGRD